MGKKRSLALGVLIGMALMFGLNLGLSPIRRHILWGGLMPPEAKIFEIYSILDRHSIVPFDKNILIDSMYRGMLAGVGDPYTYYFSKDALEVFLERTEGIYAGIGILVSNDPDDNKTTVINVFAGSPAEEAGMIPGDKIITVDGHDVTDRLLDEITALVRGVPGTIVRVQVLRGDDTINMMITRQQINVPTVAHNMLENNIGYLRIESFDRVTMGQFSEAYIDLRNQGMQGLIIDLRNNPGGLLDTVVYIGNLLLPQGPILYSENSQGERWSYDSERDNRIDKPLVVLVNGGSASASEVLTGAIRDHGVGTVVGQQTFGKGVVQSLLPLSDGSAIKVTTARYYTPNGTSIHGEGITPDYIVEVDRDTAIRATRLTLEEDIQLQKAIEVMERKFNP